MREAPEAANKALTFNYLQHKCQTNGYVYFAAVSLHLKPFKA